MFCLSIGHAIRNIAQNIPCGGLTERLRKAVRSLDVPEDQFFQFTDEIKARWSAVTLTSKESDALGNISWADLAERAATISF